MPISEIHEDVFFPKIELLHEMTMEEKFDQFEKVLEIVCSDSRFVQKAKASLVYIFTAGVEEPPVEEPEVEGAEFKEKRVSNRARK